MSSISVKSASLVNLWSRLVGRAALRLSLQLASALPWVSTQARLPPRAASSFCLPLFISQVRPLVAAALKGQIEITSPAKTSGLSECHSKKKKKGRLGGPEGNIGLERVVRTFLNIKLRSLATRANKHKVGSQRTGHDHNSSYSVLSGSFQPTVTSAWRLEQHESQNKKCDTYQ